MIHAPVPEHEQRGYEVLNTITTVARVDRILLFVEGNERSFFINEFCTREQAKTEAEAYCEGFAECARIMGNRAHAVMSEALKIEIEP